MHAPVGMNAVRERQKAPPPPPGGSQSGRGDGDGNVSYLGVLSKVEAAYVLTDWIARSKVYKMTGVFGNVDLAERHAVELDTLARLERFVSSDIGDDPDVILKIGGRGVIEMSTIMALYESSSEDPEEVPFRERVGKILAIASVSLLPELRLEVVDVAAHPAQVNDLGSIVHESMRVAVEDFAQSLIERQPNRPAQ